MSEQAKTLPEVGTLFVFGTIERVKDMPEFALFGQHRSALTPKGGLVNSAFKDSAIGEHREAGDRDLFDAVVRGAKEELGMVIEYVQAVPAGEPIVTEKSINTVFVLDTLTNTEEFHCGEGSTAIVPLKDLPHYLEKGFITEATYTTGLRVKEFVEAGRHTSLRTPGLGEALVQFAQAMPTPEQVDMDVLKGDLVSLTKDEQEVIARIRAMRLLNPNMAKHVAGALERVVSGLGDLSR